MNQNHKQVGLFVVSEPYQSDAATGLVNDSTGRRWHIPRTAFISYKWEGEEHKQWVKKFAADLRAAGIETILDVWEVKLGGSWTSYMTEEINKADVFLFIITTASVAAVEAPKGTGGPVQFEMQVATERRAADERMRLIGVYREGSKVPASLQDHRYIDFRDDSKYGEALKELVKDLLEKNSPPPVKNPNDLDTVIYESSTESLHPHRLEN